VWVRVGGYVRSICISERVCTYVYMHLFMCVYICTYIYIGVRMSDSDMQAYVYACGYCR